MSEKRRKYGRQKHQRSVDWNRRLLIRRDGMVCQLCLEPIDTLDDATIDHIQPLSKGGTDRIDNLRLTHARCNQERGSGFFDWKGLCEG